MPCTSIKGQVLVDLVAEFVESPLEERMEKQDMDENLVGLVFLQGGYTLMVQRIIKDLE